MESNKISEVSPLAPLTKLKMLDLFLNRVKDISPLASLTNLTWLCLSGNLVSDFWPLASLTSLTEIWLGHNQSDKTLDRPHYNNDVWSEELWEELDEELHIGYIENPPHSGRTIRDWERAVGKMNAKHGLERMF